MLARDFAFWLQGFFEVSGATQLDAAQTEIIQKHLNLVFAHEIDPSMGPKAHQDKLNGIHGIPAPKDVVLRC